MDKDKSWLIGDWALGWFVLVWCDAAVGLKIRPTADLQLGHAPTIGSASAEK